MILISTLSNRVVGLEILPDGRLESFVEFVATEGNVKSLCYVREQKMVCLYDNFFFLTVLFGFLFFESRLLTLFYVAFVRMISAFFFNKYIVLIDFDGFPPLLPPPLVEKLYVGSEDGKIRTWMIGIQFSRLSNFLFCTVYR